MAMGLGGGNLKSTPLHQRHSVAHTSVRGARAHEAPRAHRAHRTGHGTAARVDDLDPAAAAAPPPATGSGTAGRATPETGPLHTRKSRILPVLVASIGEAIQNQEFFQVLESWEPRLGQLSPVAPVGERKIEIWRC